MTIQQQPHGTRPTGQAGLDPGRDWRARAACRGLDPELFFPTADSGPARKVQVAAAKAVCARCPVRAECLDEALARIPYGIAGGLTEYERHRLRTARVAAPTASRQQRDHCRRGSGGRGDGLTAEAREVLSDGPGALPGRQWARIGRVLLAAGRSPRVVARACRVSERTAERWAALTRTDSHAGLDREGVHAGGAGCRDDRAGRGVGEGSAAATGLPSGSPEHTSTQAGTRAPEGHRA